MLDGGAEGENWKSISNVNIMFSSERLPKVSGLQIWLEGVKKEILYITKGPMKLFGDPI